MLNIIVSDGSDETRRLSPVDKKRVVCQASVEIPDCEQGLRENMKKKKDFEKKKAFAQKRVCNKNMKMLRPRNLNTINM